MAQDSGDRCSWIYWIPRRATSLARWAPGRELGLDNMNPYYDPSLKEARREELSQIPPGYAS